MPNTSSDKNLALVSSICKIEGQCYFDKKEGPEFCPVRQNAILAAGLDKNKIAEIIQSCNTMCAKHQKDKDLRDAACSQDPNTSLHRTRTRVPKQTR